MSDFYVYEHWRPDTNQCFYVGKGRRQRAHNMGWRNPHHKAVQVRLARLGSLPEVRIIKSYLSEREAFDLEIERIAHWRSLGIVLVNKTAGGEGISGACEETRRKIGLSKVGNKNMLGRRHSAATKAKISAAHSGKQANPAIVAMLAERNRGNKWNVGKKLSKETREKMAVAHIGRKCPSRGRPKTAAQKERLRQIHLGKKMSADAIERTTAAHRKPVICITDGKEFKSAMEAGLFYGLFNHAKVAEVCRGVRKTAAGRVFIYKEAA